MKTTFNILLWLEIVWIFLISGTNDLQIVIITFLIFGLTIFARLNYLEILDFFKDEKE